MVLFLDRKQGGKDNRNATTERKERNFYVDSVCALESTRGLHQTTSNGRIWACDMFEAPYCSNRESGKPQENKKWKTKKAVCDHVLMHCALTATAQLISDTILH
jgi:DNA gyrase/topoisomerase IV subunit A